MAQTGEISLAHRGVLFLDELPEFGSRMLEMLRQPLEDKLVSISLILRWLACLNPCPCGYCGDLVKECTCSMSMVKNYPQTRRYPAHCNLGRINYNPSFFVTLPSC